MRAVVIVLLIEKVDGGIILLKEIMQKMPDNYLPLLSQINTMLEIGPVILAIDGGSGSGKTTLSEFIEKQYECTVFHMDDFFLRPEQRIKERYAEPGGNVDRERFLEEVLIPISENEIISYRRLDCSTFQLSEPITVRSKKLVIIEGVYSMHPELAPYYTFSVFLDVESGLQRQRILTRNSLQKAERYFEEWIPLENEYFEKMHVRERCDMCISVYI